MICSVLALRLEVRDHFEARLVLLRGVIVDLERSVVRLTAESTETADIAICLLLSTHRWFFSANLLAGASSGDSIRSFELKIAVGGIRLIVLIYHELELVLDDLTLLLQWRKWVLIRRERLLDIEVLHDVLAALHKVIF